MRWYISEADAERGEPNSPIFGVDKVLSLAVFMFSQTIANNNKRIVSLAYYTCRIIWKDLLFFFRFDFASEPTAGRRKGAVAGQR
jgi:hypothetical protein